MIGPAAAGRSSPLVPPNLMVVSRSVALRQQSSWKMMQNRPCKCSAVHGLESRSHLPIRLAPYELPCAVTSAIRSRIRRSFALLPAAAERRATTCAFVAASGRGSRRLHGRSRHGLCDPANASACAPSFHESGRHWRAGRSDGRRSGLVESKRRPSARRLAVSQFDTRYATLLCRYAGSGPLPPADLGTAACRTSMDRRSGRTPAPSLGGGWAGARPRRVA